MYHIKAKRAIVYADSLQYFKIEPPENKQIRICYHFVEKKGIYT